MNPLTAEASASRPGASELVAPLVDGQTYKNLAYLVLAFPLGLVYSSILGLGFVFGVGLSVVVVGPAVLVGLLFLVRVLASFERWLSGALLGVGIDSPTDVQNDGGRGGTVRAVLAADSTWRGLGFLALKFWLGTVGVLLLFAFTTVVSMLTAVGRLPHVVEFGEANGEPVTWTIETVPEAVLAAAVGLLLGLFLVHLTNGFAYVSRRMADSLP